MIRFSSHTVAAVLACAVVATPSTVRAQHHGGGHHGGAVHGGGMHGGGIHGAVGIHHFGGLGGRFSGGSFGRPFGGIGFRTSFGPRYGFGFGRGFNSGYGFGGYGLGYGGFGLLGYGYGGYGGYGLGYPFLGYGTPGGLGPYGSYYTPYAPPLDPFASVNPYAVVQEAPRGPRAPAQIEVIVPDPNAQLLFDGQTTKKTGTQRVFETPILAPGITYTYHVSARWTQDGQPMHQDRMVYVRAGQSTVVDFRR